MTDAPTMDGQMVALLRLMLKRLQDLNQSMTVPRIAFVLRQGTVAPVEKIQAELEAMLPLLQFIGEEARELLTRIAAAQGMLAGKPQ